MATAWIPFEVSSHRIVCFASPTATLEEVLRKQHAIVMPRPI